jgi:hypothetical protein
MAIAERSALELADAARADTTISPFRLWQAAAFEAGDSSTRRRDIYGHALIHAGVRGRRRPPGALRS